MSELLQLCVTLPEAHKVIREYGQMLFTASAGILYQYSASTHQMEGTLSWGEDLNSEPVFGMHECWALRRNQAMLVDATNWGLKCAHVESDFEGSYMDIPMTTAGETPELLPIEWQVGGAQAAQSRDEAVIFAKTISLSLSNVRLRHTLQLQSVRDPLTGTYNPRYMNETLNRELPRATRKNRPVSVIVLDIDFFKKFNDTFGHAAGDLVLVRVSELLKSSIRDEDVVCRLGGEEFVILMPDSSRDVAMERAENMRQALMQQNMIYEGISLGMVTASFGVSSFPLQASSSVELLQKADRTLYRAKSNGRNRVEAAE